MTPPRLPREFFLQPGAEDIAQAPSPASLFLLSEYSNADFRVTISVKGSARPWMAASFPAQTPTSPIERAAVRVLSWLLTSGPTPLPLGPRLGWGLLRAGAALAEGSGGF